jgi:hypothetical protein
VIRVPSGDVQSRGLGLAVGVGDGLGVGVGVGLGGEATFWIVSVSDALPVLPAGSVAVAVIVCDPSARAVVSRERVHDPVPDAEMGAPSSTRTQTPAT